jgi:hypothetical protein
VQVSILGGFCIELLQRVVLSLFIQFRRLYSILIVIFEILQLSILLLVVFTLLQFKHVQVFKQNFKAIEEGSVSL